MAIKNKVKLALIGAGGRGSAVIKNMVRCTENVEVKYVCDVDDTRGGAVIRELSKDQGYEPMPVRDMRDVFADKDVDAAVITTPEHWHALATVWACRAGKDVYVEKNVCLTTGEGYEMLAAAKQNNCIVQCGTQNRSADYAFSARDYIAQGKLGEIVTVKAYCMLPDSRPWILKEDTETPAGLDWEMWLGPAPLVPYNVSRHKGWYDWWAYSGGAAMTGDASHVIDLARMVLCDPPLPRNVFCAGGRVIFNDEREIPDNQTAVFDMGSYVISLESSQYGGYMKKTPHEVRFGDRFPEWRNNSTRIEIYGTKGVMFVGRHGGGWQVFGGDSFEVVAQGIGYFPDEKHHRNFIDCIRSRKNPNAPLEQGILSAAMVNLANLSYRSGKRLLGINPITGAITDNDEAVRLDKKEPRSIYTIKP
ncbi:MAG: Gfo/Idh/MocA family oxidoreductase [Dysgonamonadaceae bacterium]|jgi:predicted dehydrogenase|nr:Gfo/Idh/MocA family oxidoreductase [Dysgonamonadaceae bacterium]